MERPGVIRARIRSIAQLREVVGAMRALAAVRMQQASDMLDGTRRYGEIVAAALSQALMLAGAEGQRPAGPHAVLLCGPEHGFVGGHTEALIQALPPAETVFAAGARGAHALAEAGRPAAWWMPAPSHAPAVAESARGLAAELTRRFAGGEFAGLTAVFARIEEGGRWRVVVEAILPPDLARFRRPPALVPPLANLAPAVLLERVVEEWFLAELARALTEALAAENLARLQAMSNAHDNIEKKLDALVAQERILRQEQITEELLDVVNGAELIRKSHEPENARRLPASVPHP
jgi:F-type H+-transporting ATPase subunit gamma